MLNWQKASTMKWITYVEEPICNNFSIKKKKKSDSLKPLTRQSFLFSFPSLLPFPLSLHQIGHFGLCPTVQYQTCLRVQINALCNFKWSPCSCCSGKYCTGRVCSEEPVAKTTDAAAIPWQVTDVPCAVLSPSSALTLLLRNVWDTNPAHCHPCTNSAFKLLDCEIFVLIVSLVTCKQILLTDTCI